MSASISRSTVLLAGRVEVGTSAHTASRVVSKLVDMEAVVARCKSRHCPRDLCLAVRCLREREGECGEGISVFGVQIK